MTHWKYYEYRRLAFTKTVMPDDPYYTYELVYPQGFIDCSGVELSGNVFYVGIGTVSRNPKICQRVDLHERETCSLSSWCNISEMPRKCQVICGIWDAGLDVQKRIVFTSLIRSEVKKRESDLIRHYGTSLTNCLENKVELKRRRAQLAELRQKAEESRSKKFVIVEHGPDWQGWLEY